MILAEGQTFPERFLWNYKTEDVVVRFESRTYPRQDDVYAVLAHLNENCCILHLRRLCHEVINFLPWVPFRCVEVDGIDDLPVHTTPSPETLDGNRIAALAEDTGYSRSL
ncbi:hypothetical protein N7454_004847 [Penicillium verhagenii]|nr:hypothetical protein N7454_004847 [Penicillium verhagenii]